MDPFTHAVDRTYPGAAGNTICPRCKSVAYRVPRRWIERLISPWRPLWRYECQATRCRWAFNLPGRNQVTSAGRSS